MSDTHATRRLQVKILMRAERAEPIYISIYIYIYIYVYIYIYTHTHTHICTYVFIYLHIYISAYTYIAHLLGFDQPLLLLLRQQIVAQILHLFAFGGLARHALGNLLESRCEEHV